VVANAGSLQDAKTARQNGAEGIGVLRTEFLFLNRSAPPGEEEQVAVYRQIAAALEGRPVIVRTLDAGGDKALGYIEQTPEANPYLGVRGLRLSLQQPGLFSTQLRAILRAGADTPLRILFPMVTDLDELLQARSIVETAHDSLLAEKLPHGWPVQVGIMVEVPAAALLAQIFAPYTDFFSIGTNDLTQYTLAAERGNPQLLAFADALHPAVLSLVRQVVQAGHALGKWAGVCGEIAGDPVAAPALVGLGADELSLNPAGIPRVKAVIREMIYSKAQELAERMLAARDAGESRKLAGEFKRE
jgi:phosphoenolpyruvate-protein kinase (PTS system EI component)